MAEQLSKNNGNNEIILDLVVNQKDAVDAIVAAQKRIDELKNAQKRLSDELKAGSISSDEYRKQMVGIKTALTDCNNVIKANEKELNNQVKAQKTNSDSLNAMRARLRSMRSEYEDLSKAERENPLVGGEQLKNIQKLNEEILNLEKTQGDYGRQVGNYEIAAKPAKQALRELTTEIQNLAVSLAQSKSQIAAQEQVVSTLATTMGKDSAAYKDAKQKLDELNAAYNTSSQAMAQMEQEAGAMRDTISDANTRINSFANDQQKMLAMQQGISVLTSSYTVLQGALTALGMKSEELINVYAKVQLVQQSVNSLLTIYKALNKDSMLMIVARTAAEKARTAYTEAYNAALAKQNVLTAADTTLTTADTVAHWSLTAAIRGVTAAIAANPIGAIIVGITAAITGLVAIVKKLSSENKKAAEEQKKADELFKASVKSYKESLKEESKAIESAGKTYNEQITRVKSLIAVVKNESAAYGDKKKALTELNKLVPAYNGAIDNTGKLIRANNAALEDYIKNLSAQAKAEAQYQNLITAYQEQGEIQRQKIRAEQDQKYYDKMLKQNQEMYAAAQSMNDYETVATAQKNIDYYTKNYEKTVAVLKDLNAELTSANKNVKAAESLVTSIPTASTKSTTTKSNPTKTKDKDVVSEAKKQYDELLKIADEYYKKLQSAGDTATEKENIRFEAEKKILVDAINAAQNLPTDSLIDPKKLSDTITQLEDYLSQVEDIHNKNLEKIKQDTENAFKDITTKLKESPEGQLQQLRDRLSAELEALTNEEQQVLAAHEYTEAQKTEISRLYAEKRNNIVAKEAKNERKLYIQASLDIASAVSGTLSNLSDMFSQLADNNAEMSKYSKALAMGQIVISAAVAMAQAVVTAINAGKDTGIGAVITVPLILAEMLGIVGGMIAQAKSTLSSASDTSKPHFNAGGYVSGAGGIDNIDARLTNGEYVLNTAAVNRIGVRNLDAINYDGASISDISNTGFDYERFAAIIESITPVVSVKEITHKQNRIRIKESI